MFSVRDVVQLQPDETIELIERRSISSVGGPLLLAAALIALPFFFLFSLLRAGSAGAIVFCLLMAVGIAAALRAFVIWDSQALIATTRRVISVDQQGVWQRKVHELFLNDIKDVKAERRSLRIEGSGSTALILVPKMPGAKGIAARILEIKAGQNGGFRLKTL